MRLPFKLYSKRKFWLWKNKIQNFRFHVHRGRYRIKKSLEEEQTRFRSVFLHFKLSIVRILKAVCIIIGLYLVEYFANSIWQYKLPEPPNWLIVFVNWIPKPTYPANKDAVIELISVIATVSGVILALFYPVLATIASTAYSKVHTSIRNLLFFEKETQGYLRRLTYLTAFAVTVLLFMSLQMYPGNLILAFLTFYSLITLFGILKIGLGVYNFFEPSTLAGIVLSKMMNIIRDVTTEGEYWNDRSFQNFYYKNALEQTENLSLITSLCVNDNDLKETSFKSSMQISFNILHFYLLQKQKIPIDSLWFPNEYNHLSYFESDSTLRDLSKSTNTYIQPRLKQNHFWFEDKIISNATIAWHAVIRNGHIKIFAETTLMTYSLLNSLSRSIDIKTARIIFDSLLNSIKPITRKKTIEQEVVDYNDWKDELGCVEAYAYALIKFHIGIFERAKEFHSNKVINEFSKINWNKKETIYLSDFIPELYETLNKFQRFVLNEYYVEGKRITPDWYYTQALASEHLRIITGKIQEAITLIKYYILDLSNHFEEQKNPLLSSFLVHIGLEDINKIRFWIQQIKPTFSDIDNLEICKGEFKWLKPEFELIEKTLTANENDCYSIISRNFEKLSTIKWNNQYPDVFSHSYSLLSSYLNKSFLENNPQIFHNIFSNFLKTSITAFNNLKQTFQHYSNPENIVYQTLIDVMQISGCAYVYSVIYKKPEFWTVTKEAWETSFFPSKENIELLTTYYNYYKNVLFGTGINYNENYQRERVLLDVIKNNKVKPQSIDDIWVKPFINESDYLTFEDTAELFMEIYLFTFIEARNATTLLKRRDIFENLIWQIEHPDARSYDIF